MKKQDENTIYRLGKINNKEQFVVDIEFRFPNRFDCSKFKFTGQSDVSIITCKKHDVDISISVKQFNRTNEPCRLCKKEKDQSIQFEIFKTKMNENFGDKISFTDKSIYNGNGEKIYAECKIHGGFITTPNIMSGKKAHGCPTCGLNYSQQDANLKTHEQYVIDAKNIHGDLYDYTNSLYVNSRSVIEILCTKCNVLFSQNAGDHLGGHGCSNCSNNGTPSNQELELLDFVKSIYSGLIYQSDRTMIGSKEIDIYLPELKIGIEYNGIKWHQTFPPNLELELGLKGGKHRNYHMDKRKSCEEVGIRLISIWEDEWVNKRDKVKSYLENILSPPENRFYARKLEMKSVTVSEQKEFLNGNHFQDYTNSSVCVGLYHKTTGDLIQLMSLKKKKDRQYEIGRLCTKKNCVVIGGSEKLFKQLKAEINGFWDVISSHNNLDKFTGEIYGKLGMNHISTRRAYFYCKGLVRVNRRNMQKKTLINMCIESGIDYVGLTESVMAYKLRWLACYTSGVSGWELKNID